MKQGHVYILTNSSLRDGFIKIGKTTKTPDERAKELSSTTSIPSTFVVAYSHEFKDCNFTEREIHKKLSDYRVNNDREFFDCSVDRAIQAFNELIIEEYEDIIRELRATINLNHNHINELKNNSKLIKYQWDLFFDRMNWRFTKNIDRKELRLKSDFILFTKDWSNEPDEDFEKNEINKIFDRYTYVYIINNLPDSSNEINELDLVKRIKKDLVYIDKQIRIVIVGITPIKANSTIWFGWEYSAVREDWNLITFVQHFDNKVPCFGLLDDDRTWFCMIRGEFLQRENLVVDENKLLEIWMKE